MKIGILSTDTLHHRYFINKIHAHFPLTAILFETKGLDKTKYFWRTFSKAKGLRAKLKSIFLSSYLQLPIWEYLEHDFENKIFFKTISRELPEGPVMIETDDVNSEQARSELKKLGLDIIISFGVKKLGEQVIRIPSKLIMNVHRGIVPRYRGLDSDLWAIYFNDFSNIGVTIHVVKPSLDTGEIIYQEKVGVSKEMRIYHMRYHTTVKAAKMVLRALGDISMNRIKISEQSGAAGYYSYMPYLLKFVAMYKFSRHLKRIERSNDIKAPE